MPYLEIDNFKMYYEVRGSGPALTFAHGASGNRLMWWQQIPAFEKDYTCISFDHRGWGSSLDDPNNIKTSQFASDLKALLDFLKIDRTAIICQSMGGITGLNFSLAHPEMVSALVLADTTGGIGEQAVVDLLQNVAPPDHPTKRALTDSFITNEPALTLLYEQIGLLNPRRERSVVSSIFRDASGPGKTTLKDFDIPIMFLVGESDLIFPPNVIEEVAKLFTNATYHVIPEAAHASHFEQPDIFNTHLKSFLSSIM
tara:strand:+ start:2199 stop:2966 length:768 start_codon:yes stop_codon:yes gene_type:complete